MAGTIASLVVELKADMTELVSASRESRDHLKNIEANAKSLEGALGSLKEFAVDAGKALLGAFTIERVLEGIKAGIESTIAYGKELRDLSGETRINVVNLQALTSETNDYGLTAQQTANLIFQLSQRVAGGDASATAAFGKLGLSIDDLKAKAPDQLFITTVTAVNSIENPLLRAGAAADFFGAKAGAAVQRLPKDFGEAVAKNREFNAAMGEDAVNAAAKWEASVDKLETTMKAFSGNTLAPLLEKMAKFATTTTDIFNATGNAPKPEPFGKPSIEDIRKGAEGMGPGGTTFSFGGKPIDATSALFGEQAANLLKSIREQLKPLTEEQERFLEQLYDMGQLTLQNAQAYNVTGAQMAAFKKKEEEIIETQRLSAETLKAQKHAYEELNISAGKAEDELTAKAMKRLEAYNALRQSILDQGRAAQAMLNDRGLGGAANQSPFDQALAARDRGYKDIEIQRDTLAKSKGGLTDNEVLAFQAMAAKVEADFDTASAAIRSGGTKIGDGLGSVASAAHMGASQVGDAFATFRGIIVGSTATDPMGAQMSRQRTLMAGGISMEDAALMAAGIVVNTGFGAGFTRRASGGPVNRGDSYLVGERGPEMFVPSASGSIVPNGGAGATTVHLNLQVNGVIDATGRQALASAVSGALEQTLRQRKWPSA